VSPGSPRAFSDVPTGHAFYREITWLVNDQITGGYPDGTFRPTLTVSRQVLASFLWSYDGHPAVTLPSPPTFADVPATYAFVTPIEWAAAEGLTGGYPDGTFRPITAVSRQSVAVILYRQAGSPAVTLPSAPRFSDVPNAHPFAEEIEWAASRGVVSGYADGTFKPGTAISRQAVAAMLYRFARLLPEWPEPRTISSGDLDDVVRDLRTAVGLDGTVHVLWREGASLRYRRLDALGNTTVAPVDLPADPIESTASWRNDTLVALPDGGAVALWKNDDEGGVPPGIYGLRIDAAGRVDGEPVVVREGYFAYLDAAADSIGRIHLVARETHLGDSTSTTQSDRLLTASFDPALVPLSPWVSITDRISSDAAIWPSVAVEPDGTTHVSWFDDCRFADGAHYDLWYARLSDVPASRVAPVQVSNRAGGFAFEDATQTPSRAPALDVARDGWVWFAWLSGKDVLVATVDPAGAPVNRGTVVSLAPVDSAYSKSYGVELVAEHQTALVLVPLGAPTARLAQVRVERDGSVASAARIVRQDGSWEYPRLTTGGDGRQLVLRADAGTGDRLRVLTTPFPTATNRPDLVVDDAHVAPTYPAREGRPRRRPRHDQLDSLVGRPFHRGDPVMPATDGAAQPTDASVACLAHRSRCCSPARP
jgi:hypothetical protein